MFYRKLPHGGEAISVICLGASSLHEAGKDAVRVVEAALDAGVNYIDLDVYKRQELMHFSYERYLENQFRKSFGFEGTPLRFVLRERSKKED